MGVANPVRGIGSDNLVRVLTAARLRLVSFPRVVFLPDARAGGRCWGWAAAMNGRGRSAGLRPDKHSSL